MKANENIDAFLLESHHPVGDKDMSNWAGKAAMATAMRIAKDTQGKEESHLPTGDEPEKLIVQTGKITGDRQLVKLAHAESVIRAHFQGTCGGPLRRLCQGDEIETTYAKFQHRDFVEGFQRQPQKRDTQS